MQVDLSTIIYLGLAIAEPQETCLIIYSQVNDPQVLHFIQDGAQIKCSLTGLQPWVSDVQYINHT